MFKSTVLTAVIAVFASPALAVELPVCDNVVTAVQVLNDAAGLDEDAQLLLAASACSASVDSKSDAIITGLVVGELLFEGESFELVQINADGAIALYPREFLESSLSFVGQPVTN